MAIQSNPFGRIEFTGTDAKKFKEQVEAGAVNPAAVTSLKKGREMMRSADENGEVLITIPTEN